MAGQEHSLPYAFILFMGGVALYLAVLRALRMRLSYLSDELPAKMRTKGSLSGVPAFSSWGLWSSYVLKGEHKKLDDTRLNLLVVALRALVIINLGLLAVLIYMRPGG